MLLVIDFGELNFTLKSNVVSLTLSSVKSVIDLSTFSSSSVSITLSEMTSATSNRF